MEVFKLLCVQPISIQLSQNQTIECDISSENIDSLLLEIDYQN